MTLPFPGNGDRKVLQDMLRQQAPLPPDLNTFRALKCGCGSIQLERVETSVIKVNPLAPKEWVELQVQQRRCAACKKYPVFDGGEWKFVVDPPPLGVE